MMKKNYINPSSSIYYINIEELLDTANQSNVTVTDKDGNKTPGPALDNTEGGETPETPSPGFKPGWSWGD